MTAGKEPRELRTIEEAIALLREWTGAYERLWLDYLKLNDRLIDAKMDLNMLDARIVVMLAEQTLREHPVLPHSEFPDELELAEAP